MPLIVAPDRLKLTADRQVVFLAGSIEMGLAENWQDELAQRLLAHFPDVVVANPRRAAWDNGWVQRLDNPVFKEQVTWELEHLERANLAVFYFQPGTQSPITVLELGKHLARPDAARSTLVCCPEGFWRRGNIEVVCQRVGLPAPLSDFEALSHAALAHLGRQA